MAKIHLNDLANLIVSSDETGKTWVILSVKQYDTVLQLVEVAKAAKDCMNSTLMPRKCYMHLKQALDSLDKQPDKD